MNIAGLLDLLRQVEAYQELVATLRGGNGPGGRLGLPRYGRPAVVAALHGDLGRPLVVLVPRVDQAIKLTEDLQAWSSQPGVVERFREPTPSPYDRAPWGEGARNNRLALLAWWQAVESPLGGDGGRPGAPLVVISARALMQKTLPRREFLSHTRSLRVGQMVRLDKLLGAWLQAGYRPATVVEEPGTFSRRGGIFDICPPGATAGVRAELFGDEVESLRSFDLVTQRTLGPLESALIPPASEALPKHGPRVASALAGGGGHDGAEWLSDLPQLEQGVPFPAIEFYLPYFYGQPATVLDHLPSSALVLVEDWSGLKTEMEEIGRRAERTRAERESGDLLMGLPPDYPSPIAEPESILGQLEERGALVLGGLLEGSDRAGLAEAFQPGPRYGGQIKPLLDHLARLHLNGERVVMVSRQAARLAELWHERGIARAPVEELVEPPADGTVTFVKGTLGDGFSLRGRLARDEGQRTLVATKAEPLLHLFTDAEVFGWARPEPRQAPRTRAIAPETHYADISPGDLVVHIDHGIGRFEGLVTRTIGGVSQEYLLVAYAEHDQLYVPVHQADRLSRYIGADELRPTLHRLGGTSWAQAKAQARQAVEEMADELLELYATREMVEGHAFGEDTPWQAELEASFPYVETEDQLGAIGEVKRDMERARPMDRLICGDVGYGKTEVALRAAFKAVTDGKQVAVLVPTTVLAQQHHTSFSQRLAVFPVEVRMLSRFRSRQEQGRILRELAAGKVDIVVGTHRLLQKDVHFHDLGLVIVDEEQRFGVAHKEILKQLRTEVDVLTMTATPIPRTLYMSLTGIRDVSIINTPPEERLPVQTHVGPYDADLVRRAVLRELDRGGQVFFVHNRVQTINSIAQQLQRLVPEARIAVGHGQMHEHELERVMLDFVGGKVDVLVSTSIIENGLDIPNANTIVIDRAELFGLSQLYQLRGRVGRGARRAYSYVFYRQPAQLTGDARARLETLAEHSELGAGYGIAMRDLEIRGAGEILGTRQHGQISAVGFDLYTRLLARAVYLRREQSEGAEEPRPGEGETLPLPDIVTIELPLSSYIPEEYIPESEFRFRLYRRMAGLTSLEAIDRMAGELADRFGPIPDEVDNLLFQLRVKLLASRAGVLTVTTFDGQIAIYMDVLEDANRPALQRYLGGAARVSKRAIWLRQEGEAGESPWQVALVQTLERLADWSATD